MNPPQIRADLSSCALPPQSCAYSASLALSLELNQSMMLTGEEVAQHSTREDLWMIIDGQVYDLTEFAPSHPGGIKILLKYAGKDATEEYTPIHPAGTIQEALESSKHLGPVDMSSGVQKIEVEEVKMRTGPALKLEDCLNLQDIQEAAQQLLTPKAWAYYHLASDDERTRDWNRRSFTQLRLRPRVLRDVTLADLTTHLLGYKASLPVFIAPAAMGRLAHPDGEKCWSRVSHQWNIPYVVSANASVGFEELATEIKASDHLLFYQLYVHKDRSKTQETLRRVKKAGYKAIIVTVDAPVAGNRELDIRTKVDAESGVEPEASDTVTVQTKPEDDASAASRVSDHSSFVDSRLSWSDLPWIKSCSGGLPIIVKGIQTAEDAAIAVYKYGVDGIYLSNHGGRQLEGAPSCIETLLEIRKHEAALLSTNSNGKRRCEIFVDGGVRRGTDVLKALALGATAVGIGRPYLYSLVFGDEGVAKVNEILQREIAGNLRLLGCTKLSDLDPDMINTSRLEADVYDNYKSPISLLPKMAKVHNLGKL